MAELSRDQVGNVLRSLGFNEVEAAGQHWFWFEYPPKSWKRNQSGNPVARIQFYAPRSELTGWLYLPYSVNRDFPGRISEYVYYEQNVRTLGALLLRNRLVEIGAMAHAPRMLLDLTLSDPSAVVVLQDWLYDHGVDPS